MENYTTTIKREIKKPFTNNLRIQYTEQQYYACMYLYQIFKLRNKFEKKKKKI